MNKRKIISISSRIALWTAINLFFNYYGLILSRMILKEAYIPPVSLKNEFVYPLIVQSFIYGLIITLTLYFLKNKLLKLFSFSIVQFVLLHISFLSGLKLAGGIHYESALNGLGLKYLGYNGQYLVEFIFSKFPIQGDFTVMFRPENWKVFYIQWVGAIVIYYLITSVVVELIIAAIRKIARRKSTQTNIVTNIESAN